MKRLVAFSILSIGLFTSQAADRKITVEIGSLRNGSGSMTAYVRDERLGAEAHLLVRDEYGVNKVVLSLGPSELETVRDLINETIKELDTHYTD